MRRNRIQNTSADGAAKVPGAEAPLLTRARIFRTDGGTEEVELAIPLGPPKFLRLPPPGLDCPVCGLSRSYLNSLILPTPANGFNPPVRSFVLKARPDCKTGVRLVDAQDLFRFIGEHPANIGGQSQ